MGCRCSRGAAVDEPQKSAAPGCAAPRTPVSGEPGAIKDSKVPGSDGSDTSTDDASGNSGSLPVSGELSDPVECMEPPRVPETESLDLGREMEDVYLDVTAGDIDGNNLLVKASGVPELVAVTTTPSMSESSSWSALEPGEVRSSPAPAKAPMLTRSASCLLGTSQREQGRRVSFNEYGPEIVHVESLVEVFHGTLRRANAVNVVSPVVAHDEDDDDDYDDDEPMEDPTFEALMQVGIGEHVPPPWAGLDGPGIYDPVLSPDRAPVCFSRFGWCCITRGEGFPVHNELEYDLCEVGEADRDLLPYACHAQEPHALSAVGDEATARMTHGACA